MKKIIICIIGMFFLSACNSVGKVNEVKEVTEGNDTIAINKEDEVKKVNKVNDVKAVTKVNEKNKVNKMDDTNKENILEQKDGNLLNKGFVVSDGKYIYYSNLYEINNWIYYVRENDGKIYKIQTDGTSKECIGGNNVVYLNVKENDIYFANDVGLYKMKKKGEAVQDILRGNIQSINIVNNDIFYINSDDGKIHKMKIDGTNNKVINEKNAICMQISNGWCYFCTRITDDYENTYKMRLDGSKLTNMKAISAVDFNISDDYMYYYEAAGGLSCIIKKNLNTDEDLSKCKAFFCGLEIKAYNVIDEIVYTCGDIWGNKNLQMDLDGKNIKSISEEEFNNEIELYNEVVRNDEIIEKFQDKFPEYKYTYDVEYKNGWWYFFIDGIYRISDDGQNTQKLIDSNTNIFAINGDWIYYLSDQEWKLSRMKFDGTDNQVLSQEKYITSICKINENEIYFLAEGDCGLCSDIKLYVLNLQDLSQKQILDARCVGFYVLGDKVIYNKVYTEKGVHVEK